jgi:hypothetical protein
LVEDGALMIARLRNPGATRPADAWLERLKHGGRLILP